MKVRPAAVAGMFYPADPDQLQQNVNMLLQNSPTPVGPVPKAMILPHAGYMYSGPVAAAACNTLRTTGSSIRRVALFGPAHRVYLEGMAVPATDAFVTPLGIVPLDRPLLDTLAILPDVCISEQAHQAEHSLEVQLPFLQTLLDDFTLVPVVVGRAAPERVAAAIDAVWGGPETLIIISSDLSHFLSYEQARQADTTTCEAILNKSTQLIGEQACGAHAINGLMQAEHCRPLTVENVALCNSGDTSGDQHKVVGYGAFILH